uniref:Coronin n=1 Tax=Sphaeramia orbicularis TaxID=375764 RepID=A0A673AP14_9TELE
MSIACRNFGSHFSVAFSSFKKCSQDKLADSFLIKEGFVTFQNVWFHKSGAVFAVMQVKDMLIRAREMDFVFVMNDRLYVTPAINYFCISFCIKVKLWRLSDPELEQPSEPELTLRPGLGRLELLLFHPTSSGLLAVGTTKSPLIWDTSRQDSPLAVLEQHSDQLQSLSWKQDGSLLASSCKVRTLHTAPYRWRKGKTNIKCLNKVEEHHHSSDSTNLFTLLHVKLWDSRKLSSSLSSVSLGTSSGCLSLAVCIVLLHAYLYFCVYQNSGFEFHADLYPDTVGTTPAMSAEEWWKGGNKQVEKVSLHPDKQPKPKATPASQTPAKKELTSRGSKEDPGHGCSTSSSPLSTPSSTAAPSRSPSSTSGLSSGFLPSPSPSQSAKFRHIQGAVMHRDTHITNVRCINLTTPGECDGFCVNSKHVAVPLSISGGQIAVFERSQPGRQPDTALPTIQNSVNVADLCWDPFNKHRLAVAGDDAKIRMWQVPEGGLKETLTEPELILQGHTEKIYSIKFHPLASGVLVSSSYDLTVRLWSLESEEEVKLLTGHEDQVFCMAWSPDGKLLATVCKDGKVRIYDPRKSTTPVQEGPGPEGHRGARVVWVCEGKYLLVSGFDSRSQRGLYLYSADSLSSGVIASAEIDVSPSTLIPFYDPDTSVVILTGKGDTRVHIYEIVPETPYFMECSSFNTPEPHKGLAFLPKTECNVRDVEVAVGLMLTKTTVEPVVFKVPRVKKEFFQDDVYPDTTVWWEPALTASAWLSGSNGQHKKISLKPNDMTPVSEAPKEAPVRKYMPSSYYLEEKTDEQKKEELLSAMVAKLGNLDEPLPQEAFEGVDDDEWVSQRGFPYLYLLLHNSNDNNTVIFYCNNCNYFDFL